MATLLGYAWIVVLKRQALELSWILDWHHVSPLFPRGLELQDLHPLRLAALGPQPLG
jgi:hypothetical protein